MHLETAEHVSPWVCKLVDEHNAAEGEKGFKAALVAQFYDCAQPEKHPALRDRSDDYRKMLLGFGDQGARILHARYKGADLHKKFGFEAVGAQFVQTFDVFWIV